MLFNQFVILLIILNILCLYVFFIEPYSFEITHIHYPLSLSQKNYCDMKIVHLSDLHISSFGWYEKKVIEKSHEQNPDLIVITGDLIAYNHDFLPVITFLNTLKKTCNIYIVFGNSDYSNINGFSFSTTKVPLKEGIFILMNDIRKDDYNNAPVHIAGLDDPITGHAKPEKLPLLAPMPGFKLLLSHAYTSTIQSSAHGVDLVLAGHTHGGQVNILPRSIMRKWRNLSDNAIIAFLDGFRKDGDSWVNVSKGVGVSFLPIRFRARPEICVITCKME